MDKDRYQIILNAIEEERKSEEEYFRNLSKAKGKHELISSGILWSPVIISKKFYTIGERIEIVLERTKHLDQPHKFKTGIGCSLVFEAEEIKEYKATVSYVRKNKMAIILSIRHIEKDGLPDHGVFSVRMIYDERSYKVMKSAIKAVIESKDEHIKILREGIRRKSNLGDTFHQKDNSLFIDPYLNLVQNEAIRTCLRARNFGIIHGPPGTGKTTTIVALVKAILQNEKRILVCAPSNNAVDLLVRRLDEKGLKVLRIGNVTRIGDSVGHLTLSEKSRNHPEWNHIKKVRIESEALIKQASTFKRKFGSKEHARRRALYKESKDLRQWADDLEEKLTRQIVESAQVIATTLISVANRNINHLNFETLIIDEASQTLEAECWAAMLKAKRVFLVGDHFQLPPTVKSDKAKKLGLEETILDRMTNVASHCSLLKEQYRMNDKILGFSNSEFYQDQLFSNEKVAHHMLENDTAPICFIDTSGCGFEETFNEEHRSLKNEGEYFILREHLLQHFDLLKNAEIGIISPYAEQVRYIKGELEEEYRFRGMDIEVNTIDGFQGQEKDVIYISLVRSNESGEIGFLKDFRRLNVAMTRARKKLTVIGDMSTLSYHPLYVRMAEYFEKHNSYQSAWEYMT